jgi:hypothetical protein
MAGRYEVSPEGCTRDHNQWSHAIAPSVMSILSYGESIGVCIVSLITNVVSGRHAGRVAAAAINGTGPCSRASKILENKSSV